MSKFEYIEIKDENDLFEHEKLLYDAYINRSPDDWISNNYEKIENCRLKAPYSYSDLIVLGVKKDDLLVATLAINKNTNNKLQLEEEGFTRDNIETTKTFYLKLGFEIIKKKKWSLGMYYCLN
jgi:hypothetical protein